MQTLSRPLQRIVQRTDSYLAFNRLAVRAGVRTVMHRARRRPRHHAWSLAYEGIIEMMTLGTPHGDIRSADAIRQPLNRLATISLRAQVQRRPVMTPLFAGEWLTPTTAAAGRVVLYLHGGGYVSGSPATHLAVTARLAHEAGARLFALDYRLAPEHPYPAALEDAWAAYWWLITEAHVAPSQIVVAGDSAGGGLTLALLLALRDAGVPLPAGGVGLSPWLDLTLSGATLEGNTATDYLNPDILRASAQMYSHGRALDDPLLSPLYADLAGLPPLLIQAGDAEMLLDDSRRFAARARAAGVDVEMVIFPHMVHVWHFMWRVEAQARQALAQIGEFVRARVAV
jgi:monoterpene epsilon-lactone hydrolase